MRFASWMASIGVICLLLMVPVMGQVNVTFQADMSTLLNSGFDPNSQVMEVRGSFNGWAASDTMEVSGGSDSLYVLTTSISGTTGETVLWKFKAGPDGDFGNGGWEWGYDRQFPLPAGDSTLPAIEPDITILNGLITVDITFQADMKPLIEQGFDPAIHVMEVRGSFNDWAAGDTLFDGGKDDSVYTVTKSITGLAGDSYFWKFKASPDEDFSNTGWELGDNREFSLPAADSTFDPIEPLITYAPVLGQNVLTTLSVDVSNAADFHTGEAFENIESIWLNGDFVPLGVGGWTGWAISDTANMVRLYDDGVNGGDAAAGDEIWTTEVQFNAGDATTHLYKYACVFAGVDTIGATIDNEGGFGQDHFVLIDDSSPTYSAPTDEWTTQAPITDFPEIVVQGTALSDFANDTLIYYINEGPLGYDQPLTIRNVGSATLSWSITDEDSVGADCPNISVSPSDSSTAVGGTTTIIVTLDPVGLATDNVYYCDMLIASNDPATPVYTITVCINVISKWAEFTTEVQSVPPGNPIAPGDSIRDLFTFINNTGAEQTVRISTKWLRNTGQLQDQLSQRSPVLGRFEVNSNRNKKFAVPTTMPLDTNWVISYIEHINGDTICTDTAAFEVVSAETKAAMLGLAYGVGIPDQIALHRNYPNPFNPSTTIKYDLNEDTHVKIQVFNVLGQQVKTLVDGFEEAGYKQIIWDGTNNKGQSVASGIYIYRMEVLSSLRQGSGTRFMKTYKMLLTK